MLSADTASYVGPDEMVLFKIPEEINGEIHIKNYKQKNQKGAVLITKDKTYKIICREDSNTFLVRDKNNISEAKLCLECVPVHYGEKEILEILPVIGITQLAKEKSYMPVERVEQIYPMSKEEYKNILCKIQGINIEINGKEYMARVEKALFRDALLLTRSLLTSLNNRNNLEIRNAFSEILPCELYQVIEGYTENGELKEKEIEKKLCQVLREEAKDEEEYKRSLYIHGLQWSSAYL